MSFFSCLTKCFQNPAMASQDIEGINNQVNSEVKKQTSSIFEELDHWKAAMEKRIETLESAQKNIKSTSAQHQLEVKELRQDMEMMQDNVIVEIAK